MSTELSCGVVGYTDGGASPNPGPTGGGIHLYFYHYPTEKEKPTRFGRFIATDAGYLAQKDYDALQSKGKAPLPVFIDKYHDIVVAIGHGTNNVGEMTAMLEFLRYVARQLDDGVKLEKAIAISDSTLVIRGVNEFIKGWVQRDWIATTGKPVANREIWEAIIEAKAKLEGKIALTCNWVLGHNDDFGNTRSDIQASLGVNYASIGRVNEIYEQSYVGSAFFNSGLEFHPFFSAQRIYFNSVAAVNDKGIYYQTNGGDEKFVTGKRTGDAMFSVIKLFNPDPLADILIDSACRDEDVNTILYFRRDRANELDLRQMAELHGSMAFVKDKRNLNLNFVDKKPVVMEVKAGELPLRTIEVLELLEEILNGYEKHPAAGPAFAISGLSTQIFDLTSHFYDTVTKKSRGKELETMELKKSFGVGTVNTEVEVPVQLSKANVPVKLNLMFGLDIPLRNAMKRIEGTNPVVQLVVWLNGEQSMRFATIIRTDEAIGIWSNYHASLLLIPHSR